jgi:hypothetical protein
VFGDYEDTYALAAMFYNALTNPHHLYMVPESDLLISARLEASSQALRLCPNLLKMAPVICCNSA